MIVILKFSCCIDMMFASLPFEERIAETKKCGVDAVEFWKWSNKDVEKIAALTGELGMKTVLMNLDCTDEKLSYDLSRGILVSGRKEELKAAFYESLPVLRTLSCDSVIVLAGEHAGLSEKEEQDNIFECLKAIAPCAEEEGVNILLEPLNDFDRQNYALPHCVPAFEILHGVASPRVKLLYDIYHTQRMDGNVIDYLTKEASYIGHFHVANSPLRCEPDRGELNYKAVFEAIEGTGYDRFVGFEYRQKREDFSLREYLSEIGYAKSEK